MREETGDGSNNKNNNSSGSSSSSRGGAGDNNNKSPDAKLQQSIESAAKSCMEHVATDEEFVGPEFEEDAYYCYSLAATPSFDDLDGSDSEEILVHWHHDTGEIEEIEEADFQQRSEAAANAEVHGAEVRTTTRGELRRLRARIRDRLMALVRRGRSH